MTDQEERALAGRLAEVSEILNFDKALRIVKYDPAEAERLIRMREEDERRERERARLRDLRELALRQDYG